MKRLKFQKWFKIFFSYSSHSDYLYQLAKPAYQKQPINSPGIDEAFLEYGGRRKYQNPVTEIERRNIFAQPNESDM
jgi:hypothetical protein